MSKKTLYITAGVVLIIGGIAAAIFFQRLNKGASIQEVSASGKVELPTQIDLRFKNSGKLVVLNARVGEKFSVGQLLAKQDTAKLNAQIAEIQTGIDLQKAKLGQLLGGASAEDINIAEMAVSNAETAVANARQALEDAKKNLINKLKDAYAKSDDAVRDKTDQLFYNPKSYSPQLSFVYTNSQLETDVEHERLSIESVLNAWLESLNAISMQSDLSSSAALADKNTDQINSFLNKIALIINDLTSSSNLSQTTINKWGNDISTARKNVNAAISNLSAAEENINTKEARLKTAEDDLKTAQNKLILKKAPARSQDIAVYEAKISQDRASMQKIQVQIQDLIIIAPSSGIVTKISGEVGKVVGPGAAIISLVPSGVFQIKLNVAENDMVKVKLGQEARIMLDALEGKEFSGQVVTIDRAKITVLFDEEDERIKPGMAANVWIKTATSTGI